MTSLSLFPRPLALSAYSAVSGSRMTLCLAISCSALFACRSPPLLSLCLTVLPLEAGIGQAPHIAANDASERSLPGLSPAATVSVNIIFTISTNAFSPIAPTRMRRIRQRGCAAFGA